MQWVILLYAFLEYPDSGAIEKVVSRNLPFQSFEKCEQFYHQNKNNLIPEKYLSENSEFCEGSVR